eukprot:TRINITY_DN20908_c0_g1_i2.p1 TRINITY_DN20908_c0_g1~~TRINITY_DN20908_c0_g1_i2.p1  ORF type:complete len:112 (+),score=25.50 TRINITY_DN20908_c0_g1_i2:70-405(+)
MCIRDRVAAGNYQQAAFLASEYSLNGECLLKLLDATPYPVLKSLSIDQDYLVKVLSSILEYFKDNRVTVNYKAREILKKAEELLHPSKEKYMEHANIKNTINRILEPLPTY